MKYFSDSRRRKIDIQPIEKAGIVGYKTFLHEAQRAETKSLRGLQVRITLN